MNAAVTFAALTACWHQICCTDRLLTSDLLHWPPADFRSAALSRNHLTINRKRAGLFTYCLKQSRVTSCLQPAAGLSEGQRLTQSHERLRRAHWACAALTPERWPHCVTHRSFHWIVCDLCTSVWPVTGQKQHGRMTTWKEKWSILVQTTLRMIVVELKGQLHSFLRMCLRNSSNSWSSQQLVCWITAPQDSKWNSCQFILVILIETLQLKTWFSEKKKANTHLGV